VGLPVAPYFASISPRIAAVAIPWPVIRITSRVMSRQRLQVAAWLVNVVDSAVSPLM
jgi:hypothetical protein